MDKSRRKELQEQYKNVKTYLGVVQITNKANGKIYIDSYPNLKNKWLMLQSQLEMGRFVNLQLQKDWNELGPESFAFEVLEQKDAGEIADVRWELKQMEKKWLERLQPYDERGYNRRKE